MDISKCPGLYRITSPSGRQYIGITTTSFQKRYTEHLRHPRVSTLIGKAFRKYGEAMMLTPLVVCDDQEALDRMEQNAIQVFDTMAPKGYNLSPGGNSPQRETMTCQSCGDVFQGKAGTSKFCSNNCKSAARRESGVDLVTKECARCGERFISQKYYNICHCSRNCAYAERDGVSVTVDGVIYRSLSEAERAIGLSRYIIRKRHTA